MAASAACSTSCTVPPPGWVCQPRNRLPSYSSPMAMREIARGLGELREQLLRGAALRGVAILQHFLEQLTRAVLVAHLLVGLGEVELGGHLLPFRVSARLGEHGGVVGRIAEIEADRAKVD